MRKSIIAALLLLALIMNVVPLVIWHDQVDVSQYSIPALLLMIGTTLHAVLSCLQRLLQERREQEKREKLGSGSNGSLLTRRLP